MKRLNLRLRLLLGFMLLTLLCWGAAAILAWQQTRHNINELFDTQQLLFAKRLATLTPQDLQPQALPAARQITKKARGEQDEDALAFAIFRTDGQRVLSDDDNGKRFLFSDYRHDGFTTGQLHDDDDLWRLVWLTTPDKRYVVAVGQEVEYRHDMALDIVKTNLTPWLAALPVMLILLFLLVTYELRPLTHIARQLGQRRPDDESPIATPRVPPEVRPLVDALNGLFARINAMLTRERRFTSDAAHELRSPLAALKVQAEVVQLAHDDEEMRRRALGQLDAGIDRATRLVDQLLTLSRLDVDNDPASSETVHWQPLLEQAVADQTEEARRQGVTLNLNMPETPVATPGNALLLTLLVRNLLDNAIRYGSNGASGVVRVMLTMEGLEVADEGPGVHEEILLRLGERFFRPPGQEASGSGLGLSIVNRIAHLHGMTTRFANLPGGGFSAQLTWPLTRSH
ncbi:two-component sensor histidine kinase [Lonsdalea iberica]|uniref:Sensor protein QseC n=1 Tax=Lonsdalea iberica TaxID=1082703 RepID=A0ABX3XIX3_9GAMM|nr:quorum sensing histidine kinase QseC [Lonsdalea iberica]OSN11505.1 two-component sensor histidine kinase [Lonsdalea iberica]